jgi:hypothetical protein
LDSFSSARASSSLDSFSLAASSSFSSIDSCDFFSSTPTNHDV